jgi:hypothetical protein
VHHLNGAAGQPERHPHQLAGPGPIDKIVGGRREEAFVCPVVGDSQKNQGHQRLRSFLLPTMLPLVSATNT